MRYVLTKGKSPYIIFIHGFKSDMEGAKALALEHHCRALKQGFIRFDLTGHGTSSGEFTQCTISTWLEDCLAITDNLADQEVILVGSSLGGWLMLLTALKRQERIKGLLGIAAAPDCIDELIYKSLTANEKNQLKEGGTIYLKRSPDQEDAYPITPHLIKESRAHNLLDKKIPLTCPLRLIHGDKDESVPYSYSQKILSLIQSQDASLTLIKEGDHRLSSPAHIAYILEALNSLIKADSPSL